MTRPSAIPPTSATSMPGGSARGRRSCPTTTPTSRRSAASMPVRRPSTSSPTSPPRRSRGRCSPMRPTPKDDSSTPTPMPVSATTAGSTPCAPPAGAAPVRSRGRTRSTAGSSARSMPSAAPRRGSGRAKKPRASRSSSAPPTRPRSTPSSRGEHFLRRSHRPRRRRRRHRLGLRMARGPRHRGAAPVGLRPATGREIGRRLGVARHPDRWGEVLAEAARFPPTAVATESWPPNIARATSLLHPRGVVVVADPDEPPRPSPMPPSTS